MLSMVNEEVYPLKESLPNPLKFKKQNPKKKENIIGNKK